MLEADRQADESVGDRRLLRRPATATLPRRLDTAEARGVHPQVPALDGGVGGIRASSNDDRYDRAEAGVTHLFDGGVLGEAANELLGIGLGPLESNSEG